MSDADAHLRGVLHQAGVRAGVLTADARLIRHGTNALYQLPGGVIARVGPPGSSVVAGRQVEASRWLAGAGIPVVRVIDGIEQPTVVEGRPVTWWVQLPEHRPATPAELGAVLKRLHALAVPKCPVLSTVDPFEGLTESLDTGAFLAEGDRAWLQCLVERLRGEYRALLPGLSWCVIHGDAWQGNVVVPQCGEPVLLDLDHLGVGPREWDLVSLAADYTDFARLARADYEAFVAAYGGYDMTTWSGYRTLATIRELRWTAFVLGKANVNQKAVDEARHRVACLRGEIDRPWSWLAF